MGLDMSLILRTKVKSKSDNIDLIYSQQVKSLMLKAKDKSENTSSANITDLIYWRKANQIRRWFADNLKDFEKDKNFGEYLVTKQDLEFLVDDINKVLKSENKVETAQETMPTSSGFFFGSTDYDDDYFKTLETTLEQITDLLNTLDWENMEEKGEKIYYTEWW